MKNRPRKIAELTLYSDFETLEFAIKKVLKELCYSVNEFIYYKINRKTGYIEFWY